MSFFLFFEPFQLFFVLYKPLVFWQFYPSDNFLKHKIFCIMNLSQFLQRIIYILDDCRVILYLLALWHEIFESSRASVRHAVSNTEIVLVENVNWLVRETASNFIANSGIVSIKALSSSLQSSYGVVSEFSRRRSFCWMIIYYQFAFFYEIFFCISIIQIIWYCYRRMLVFLKEKVILKLRSFFGYVIY